MRFVAPSRLMGFYALANIALVSVAVFQPGWVGIWCVFLTSFFMSLMFPTIFALGLKGLGPNTKIGGSFLVMAIIGGAILTPLMGLVSEKFHSLAFAYTIPLIAYMYITLYSFLGSRRVGIPA
jgi:FHS family L-fucose permease-like MFS transporter